MAECRRKFHPGLASAGMCGSRGACMSIVNMHVAWGSSHRCMGWDFFLCSAHLSDQYSDDSNSPAVTGTCFLL